MTLLTLVLVNVVLVIAILLVGRSEAKQGRWLESVRVGDMPSASKREPAPQKKLAGIIGEYSEMHRIKERLERVEKLIERLLAEYKDIRKDMAKLRTARVR